MVDWEVQEDEDVTMAIHIHCPHCHKRLETLQQQCSHCHQELPPGVLYALGMALGVAPTGPSPMVPGQPPVHLRQPPSAPAPPPLPETHFPEQSSALRPWLAAVLSLVCGLGQLYNGQAVKGMVLIILGTAALFSFRLAVGKILLPLLWSYAIIDAYIVARRLRRDEISVDQTARDTV